MTRCGEHTETCLWFGEKVIVFSSKTVAPLVVKPDTVLSANPNRFASPLVVPGEPLWLARRAAKW